MKILKNILKVMILITLILIFWGNTRNVRAEDVIGNDASNEDVEAPIITDVKVQGYKITVTATDNMGLAEEPYSIDGTNYQASNVLTVTIYGEYTVYVKDKQGNIASQKVIVPGMNEPPLYVDTEAPIITDVKVQGYKITVTATDNIGLAEEPYSIDGINYQSSNVLTVTIYGEYTIYVKDKQGNVASQKVIVPGMNEPPLYVDKKEPVITDIKVEGYKITITATDEEMGLAEKAYSLDGNNWQESNVFTVENAGNYTVYIRDKAGNTTSKHVDIKATTDSLNSSKPVKDDGDKDNTKSKSKLPSTGLRVVMPLTIILVISTGFWYVKCKQTNFYK